MEYKEKDFTGLLGLPGFSNALLENHFKLYSGYVANFNKLDQILMQMEKEGRLGTPEYNELNRRLGWEFNGMRLHELYFGNMSKAGRKITAGGKLHTLIQNEWGSLELWEKDFVSMGAMRGIGWVILYHDPAAGRLFNVWINEHDVGHFSGCTPLLVMDVFEHAYLADYGLKRADYIKAFMSTVDWKTVESRL
ncbi:MAG: Fe-Mn family superoxide dismutase [Candidatus Micrarchaeota archaeon]|nr:Fe-Mn family superoxide dismutase [Candidatus Micrarchaeota archaeon]